MGREGPSAPTLCKTILGLDAAGTVGHQRSGLAQPVEVAEHGHVRVCGIRFFLAASVSIRLLRCRHQRQPDAPHQHLGAASGSRDADRAALRRLRESSGRRRSPAVGRRVAGRCASRVWRTAPAPGFALGGPWPWRRRSSGGLSSLCQAHGCTARRWLFHRGHHRA